MKYGVPCQCVQCGPRSDRWPQERNPESALLKASKPGPLEAVNGEALEFNDSVEEEGAPAEESLAAGGGAPIREGAAPQA